MEALREGTFPKAKQGLLLFNAFSPFHAQQCQPRFRPLPLNVCYGIDGFVLIGELCCAIKYLSLCELKLHVFVKTV